jgi:hypothetical protein
LRIRNSGNQDGCYQAFASDGNESTVQSKLRCDHLYPDKFSSHEAHEGTAPSM